VPSKSTKLGDRSVRAMGDVAPRTSNIDIEHIEHRTHVETPNESNGRKAQSTTEALQCDVQFNQNDQKRLVKAIIKNLSSILAPLCFFDQLLCSTARVDIGSAIS
jgi:hypothetical protein